MEQGEAHKRRRGAEDLRSISLATRTRVLRFPERRGSVGVVPGHRSTALCTFFLSFALASASVAAATVRE